MDVNDGPVSSD